jgi:hypothetical protein
MTFRACSSPAPTLVKPQPAPPILSQESAYTILSITHHTRKQPSTGPRTTHGPQTCGGQSSNGRRRCARLASGRAPHGTDQRTCSRHAHGNTAQRTDQWSPASLGVHDGSVRRRSQRGAPGMMSCACSVPVCEQFGLGCFYHDFFTIFVLKCTLR